VARRPSRLLCKGQASEAPYFCDLFFFYE
jgi:hypothetical protein